MCYTTLAESPVTAQPPPPTPVAGPAPPRFPQAQGESDRACEAFRAYLELGPGRRYAAVARKVGASLRTIKRWAADFDWPGRIKTYAAGAAEEFAETEQAVHREELLDANTRVRALRERQYTLAQGLLDAAERYLDNLEEGDLDRMSFADACKAVEVASRLGQQAERGVTEDPAGTSRNLRDQLATLLEQVFHENPVNGTGDPSQPATPPQPKASLP
jgi:hypothetical protein